MTKKIWKMCVVGLMLASPAICSAVTIDEALEAAGDGMYVKIAAPYIDESGHPVYSSITLDFTPDCYGVDPAVILYFTQDTGGFMMEFYLDGQSEGTYSGLDGLGSVYWEGGPFDRVTITAYDTLYLDAVQGVLENVEEGPDPSVGGTYAAQTGTVIPLTDDPAVMIVDLIDMVEGVNTANGIPNNSLEAKLQAALNALDDANSHNDAAAINSLENFIDFCDDQVVKEKITDDQAAELKGQAQKIITILTGPTS